MTRPLDLAPLTSEVTPGQIADARDRLRGQDAYASWMPGTQTATIVVAAIFAVVLGGFFALMVATWATGGVRVESSLEGLVTFGVALVFLGGMFVAAVTVLVRAARSSRSTTALLRIERFAAANRLRFSPRDRNGIYDGQRLPASGSWLLDHLTTRDGDVDYGSIGRSMRGGTVEPTGVGYLAIRLDRKLPHIVLHRGREGFGVVGDGAPLELEGDVGKHFTLHVSPGYERDALYLFTPDVLVALLDEARDVALEIVDEWLLLYTEKLDLTDPATHERMRRLVDTVGAELRHQADAYRDDRLERDIRLPLVPDRVGRRGRRLPTFVWIPGVLLALALASSPWWGVIAGALQRLLGG